MEIKFDHLRTEKGKYRDWLDKDLFNCDLDSNNKPYSIILPPPNVTGKLHLGHAWDGTLQDILIRYKKMNGYNVLWIPGMDHAGIATQAKVSEELTNKGIDVKSLSREEFISHAWDYKKEYASIIRQQWEKLGFALDYDKEKFTLDEDVNKMVNNVFVKLYEEGLIYKGYKITNWDPKAMTAISDIEVIHKEIEGKFYHFKYEFEDGSGYLEVATTRPETMFGDVALAVNPSDDRYTNFVGKNVYIPGTNILIPIISDDYVDIEFGTGVVKITPAHDPNDYEVAQRHNLEMPIVMNLDGTMNEKAFEFVNMDRFDCRNKLVSKLEDLDKVIKIEDHTHNVGHSERSGVVVESILSEQWYIKMNDLSKKAIYNQNKDKIDFYPKRFEDTFLSWMENIQDWCISRQLVWGHQIPVWYHNETNEIYVGVNAPSNEEEYTRDSDVLDTWFSSALWPIATILWDKDERLDKFFPTNVLVTGYDIIFFWVSRMIFQSLHFEDVKPFNDVLIHGLIRAEDGKKMSKSLGNGIDPMDVIDSHGADALRLFLTSNSAPGLDLRFSQSKLDSSWNFLNKVWNVSRYVLLNTSDVSSSDINYSLLDNSDKYVLEQLNILIKNIDVYMEKYEFGEVNRQIYNFIWDDFASNYIETTKIFLNDDNEISNNKKVILKSILVDVLKILHPFCPFITEDIYKEISDNNIYLEYYATLYDYDFSNNYNQIKDVILSVRNFKAENNIKPSCEIVAIIDSEIEINDNDIRILKSLLKIKETKNIDELNDKYISIVNKDIVVHILNDGLIDNEAKLNTLFEKTDKLIVELNRSIKILSNKNFIEKASEEKKQKEINKLVEYKNLYLEAIDLLKENDQDVNNSIIEEVNKLLGEI